METVSTKELIRLRFDLEL